jgi:integrase
VRAAVGRARRAQAGTPGYRQASHKRRRLARTRGQRLSVRRRDQDNLRPADGSPPSLPSEASSRAPLGHAERLRLPRAAQRSSLLQSWRRRFWNPAVEASGLVSVTPHSLRHSAAALMIDQGANPVAVQRRLGHRDIRTTLQLYGHRFPEQDDVLTARLEALRASVAG